MDALLSRIFRANPDYELVDFAEVDARADREPLGRAGPTRSGSLLRPRPHASAALRLKSACPDTARLLRSLEKPGPLPRLNAMTVDELESSVARLVLDSLVQVEVDGVFLGGTAAHSALGGLVPAPVAPRSALAALSEDAVRYAEILAINEPPRLAERMYMYNGVPASAHWRRRLSTPDAVWRHWGLEATLASARHQPWLRLDDGSDHHWWSWRLPIEDRVACRDEAQWRYKLYVSPAPELAGEALAAAVEALASVGQGAFKVGCDVHGVLRPDKLVCYFTTIDLLWMSADRIGDRLRGLPAQGVPFTAELAGPLLSWGVDPLVAEDALGPPDQSYPPTGPEVDKRQGRVSWRQWITNRLALHVITARTELFERAANGTGIQSAPGASPSRFAIDRLRYDGVNTDSWSLADEVPAPHTSEGVS